MLRNVVLAIENSVFLVIVWHDETPQNASKRHHFHQSSIRNGITPRLESGSNHDAMKRLVLLLAALLVVGCGEKVNCTSCCA